MPVVWTRVAVVETMRNAIRGSRRRAVGDGQEFDRCFSSELEVGGESRSEGGGLRVEAPVAGVTPAAEQARCREEQQWGGQEE